MADVELMEPATAFRMARGAAERAIELDSNTAQGYLAMAWVQINRNWNWDGAELSLNKARRWNLEAPLFWVTEPMTEYVAASLFGAKILANLLGGVGVLLAVMACALVLQPCRCSMKLTETIESVLKGKGSNTIWSVTPEQSVYEAIEKRGIADDPHPRSLPAPA